uniref:Transposable element Tc1 transposase n=1 Tax=Heterorhabditis bacteriophora TaxID=37862 RepID=A0A1I7XDJ3_HETBA
MSVEEVLRLETRSAKKLTSFHTSGSTKILKNNDVDTPHLNPMENLWVILVSEIHVGNLQLETVNNLQSVISKSGREVDKSVIKNLGNSMPEWTFQINRSGDCTEY